MFWCRRRQQQKKKHLGVLLVNKHKSQESKSANQLIKDMHENTSSLSTLFESGKSWGSAKDYEYVFQLHRAGNKSETEQKIAWFLDTQSVYQINWKVALEDYKIEF